MAGGLITVDGNENQEPRRITKRAFHSEFIQRNRMEGNVIVFLIFPFLLPSFWVPASLLFKRGSLHGVVLISDPRLRDFIINSVFNLQSKEKAFL